MIDIDRWPTLAEVSERVSDAAFLVVVEGLLEGAREFADGRTAPPVELVVDLLAAVEDPEINISPELRGRAGDLLSMTLARD